jgi:hypothetical protein
VPPLISTTPDAVSLQSDGSFNFMDNETYEQIALSNEQLGDATRFLKENMNIGVLFFQGIVIGIDLPTLSNSKSSKQTPASAAIPPPAAPSQPSWKQAIS